MKITNLLAQYLYTKKQLDLPGIGTFTLDNDIVLDSEKTKHNKTFTLEGVSFIHDRTVKEDPDLIAFISEHSGKIKALASADLNSHLELASQFLNIGKPFLFEGIGSLVKTQSGEFSFTPGQAIPDRIDSATHREYGKEAMSEEPVGDYKSVFYNKHTKSAWKKPAAIGLILLGFGLAIWGGYTVYKKRAERSEKEESVVSSEKNKPNQHQNTINESPDTITQKEDTIAKATAISTQPPIIAAGTKKFILEVSPKERALYRYNRLKTFQWQVEMETRDSSSFTLYMLLPVSPADTSRVLDSLSRLNGKRVYISQ
ncbi:MAG: hypothetical protein JNK98_04415 [Chitinophagaceae bacterium]|nr:hypothetical protein [Chitinophagaceae bacterium]